MRIYLSNGLVVDEVQKFLYRPPFVKKKKTVFPNRPEFFYLGPSTVHNVIMDIVKIKEKTRISYKKNGITEKVSGRIKEYCLV